ncbi:hypothetical protein EV2_028317 [Malus domestica]
MFIPPKYIDCKKQEFTQLKQGKMATNEYYKRFTNLSRYHLEVAANPVEMLHRFRLGTKKKWRSITTLTPYATYQKFYEILLRIEDSENMPSESENEEKKMGIRGEMIKVKVSLLRDLARLRALRRVELVPVLLMEVLVPLVR